MHAIVADMESSSLGLSLNDHFPILLLLTTSNELRSSLPRSIVIVLRRILASEVGEGVDTWAFIIKNAQKS